MKEKISENTLFITSQKHTVIVGVFVILSGCGDDSDSSDPSPGGSPQQMSSPVAAMAMPGLPTAGQPTVPGNTMPEPSGPGMAPLAVYRLIWACPR